MPGARITAVANQKGGVGKTTTAVNLAAAWAEAGKKILLIDLDPQGNASTGLGIAPQKRNPSAFDFLTQGVFAPQRTLLDNLWVIPASRDLNKILREKPWRDAPDNLLRDALKALLLEKEKRAAETKSEGEASPAAPPHLYDDIILDCPPGLSSLTSNAFCAARSLIVPLQCEFYALEGLSQLFQTVESLRSSVNPDLRIDGILLTMADGRNSLSEQVEADVRAHMGAQVYKTVIPRNVRLSEAPSHGMPATLYDSSCSGSLAYKALAEEIGRRRGGRGGRGRAS